MPRDQERGEKKTATYGFTKSSEGNIILFIYTFTALCSLFICSSSSRRACRPWKKKTDTVTASTQIPLNMIARCMLRGGRAAGEARRESCTAMDEAKRKKERKSGKRCHNGVEGRNTRLPRIKTMLHRLPLRAKED